MLRDNCIDTIPSPTSSLPTWEDWIKTGATKLQEDAVALMDLVKMWHGRSKQRRALAKLNARMLEDIGLSAAQAGAEINKPFWKE